MTTHLSARLTWHDSGWNGTVCRDPKANVYCTVHDHIRDRKNDELQQQVESEVDLLRDPRILGLLRSASNFSGRRDSMVEKTNGDRVTYVQGEGVFARAGGRRLDFVDVREPEHLEALERSRMALESVHSGDG